MQLLRPHRTSPEDLGHTIHEFRPRDTPASPLHFLFALEDSASIPELKATINGGARRRSNKIPTITACQFQAAYWISRDSILDAASPFHRNTVSTA